jgi:class 3 adenylate cyclase/tetratricopeptide (TPR) repeat protein
MKCPKCQTENPEADKFCHECGAKLLLTCPQCGAEVLAGDKFCRKCGQRLKELAETQKRAPETEGERKYVTVLFSDLSGYTAMSERLDPEEVKEIISRIFGEIAQVVTKYEGFIEKFIGDAVVALFGVPKAHEDDPLRAIRAAREIHDLVEGISPQLEERVGQPLSMHTGINTGLVVTGEVDLEKGTHGVAGDTINLASRLSTLATAAEILVGQETYRQAEGHFTFEHIEPTKLKGKAQPVPVYKVLSAKERPITTHRPSGLRADFIGRRVELSQLNEAVQRLLEGKGTVFSICGDAGTGKSRLLEEFKATLDPNEIQWLEGHAYAYSQNIPYFPLIDLLNRAWHIEEGDPPEKVRGKIESGVADLVEEKGDILPYIGSLYALSYPEVGGVSPEFWKARLQDTVRAIFSALARRAPTVMCLEDIQWADPSSLDLLRFLLLELTYPALFLCVYRLPFSLLTSHQLGGIGKLYQEIRLQDLSPSDTQDMMESLLKSKTIPQQLRRFIQEKVEGNPFYLEEVINSLIESGTLTRDNGNWRLARSIGESDIPPTLQGVISARLDRLEREMKRILQEASVIGRAFLYEILTKITELKDHIDSCLHSLEQLDLIRTRSFQPELEYVFKHALTQEVVYSGLLKKERKEIHERIALVMEQIFHDRLPEFYETLAFHFKEGQSIHKAVDYLMKSGEKSVGRYAVEEAHQYYREAFDILSNKPEITREEEGLLIDLLIRWALVFYHRGDFSGLDKLFSAHEDLAESLDDKARLGMFYAWLGFAAHIRRGRPKDSYQYLCRALELGEEIGNQQVIGYACTWLSWTCSDLALFDEAIHFGEKAQEISRILTSDHYLFFKSLAGLGQTYWFKGESKKNLEIGRILLDYGRRHSNIRSSVVGHIYMGCGHSAAGNFTSAIECYKRATEIAADPFYSHWGRIFLGATYVQNGQFEEAEEALREIVSYCEDFGCEYVRPFASGFLGIVVIVKGHIFQGLRMLEEARQSSLENERKFLHAMIEHLLGKVYLQIVQGEGPKSFSLLARNIGFLIKDAPFATKKAEEHLTKAIEVAKETGARGILGQAYLDLGLLHKAKKRNEQAKACISEAISIFEQCEAEVYLKQAKGVLASLR